MAHDDSTVDKELSDKIHDVIAQHLSDNGGMIDTWIGIIDYINEDGERCWHEVYPTGQFFDRSMQLVQFHYHLNLEIQRLNINKSLIADPYDEGD